MNESISSALKNWVPIKLYEEQEAAYCRWLYTGNETFTDPFFDETIGKCWNLPENSAMYKTVSNAANCW